MACNETDNTLQKVAVSHYAKGQENRTSTVCKRCLEYWVGVRQGPKDVALILLQKLTPALPAPSRQSKPCRARECKASNRSPGLLWRQAILLAAEQPSRSEKLQKQTPKFPQLLLMCFLCRSTFGAVSEKLCLAQYVQASQDPSGGHCFVSSTRATPLLQPKPT